MSDATTDPIMLDTIYELLTELKNHDKIKCLIELPNGDRINLHDVRINKKMSLRDTSPQVLTFISDPSYSAKAKKPAYKSTSKESIATLLESTGLDLEFFKHNTKPPKEVLELANAVKYKLFYQMTFKTAKGALNAPLPLSWHKNIPTGQTKDTPIFKEDVKDWSIYDKNTPPPWWILEDLNHDERYFHCYKAKIQTHRKKSKSSVKILPDSWRVSN